MSMLSSFIKQPASFHFETQEPNETIILILRAHPITTVRWILIALFIAVFPLLLFVQPALVPLPITPSEQPRFDLIFTLIFELFALGYVFENFLIYYFSVYIVTNVRVLDIDFSSLLAKKVSETQLGEIEDVTYTQNGIFSSIFNYGDVITQTAGTAPEFNFHNVPRPNEVAEIVDNLEPKEEGP